MACATVWAIAQRHRVEVAMGWMDGKVAFVAGARVTSEDISNAEWMPAAV